MDATERVRLALMERKNMPDHLWLSQHKHELSFKDVESLLKERDLLLSVVRALDFQEKYEEAGNVNMASDKQLDVLLALMDWRSSL